jgi:hypothetical protein
MHIIQVWPVACSLTILFLTACRPSEPPPVETVEEPTEFLTMIHVADPKAAPQLLKGFHDVEQNSWRWAMKDFSISLKPPANSLERGAVLRLNFTLPDAVAKKVGPLTLAARIGETALAPETCNKAGDYAYIRDIPPAKIGGDAAVVDFSFDKALAPGGIDRRELSVIVTSAGFEAK